MYHTFGEAHIQGDIVRLRGHRDVLCAEHTKDLIHIIDLKQNVTFNTNVRGVRIR